jgi:hypothetical protein
LSIRIHEGFEDWLATISYFFFVYPPLQLMKIVFLVGYKFIVESFSEYLAINATYLKKIA